MRFLAHSVVFVAFCIRVFYLLLVSALFLRLLNNLQCVCARKIIDLD